MYKIAVIGDRDSVLGFRALGLDVFPTEDTDAGRRTLHRLAQEDYAVIRCSSAGSCRNWPGRREILARRETIPLRWVAFSLTQR